MRSKSEKKSGFIQVLVFSLSFSLAFPAGIFLSPDAHAESQKEKYLKAAKSADKAADTSELLMKVWGGVGVVCLAICIASMCGGSIISAGADNYICMGASLGAGITDAMMTKKVEGAIAGIIGPAVSLATMGGGAAAGAAGGVAKAAATAGTSTVRPATGAATSAATAATSTGGVQSAAATLSRFQLDPPANDIGSIINPPQQPIISQDAVMSVPQSLLPNTTPQGVTGNAGTGNIGGEVSGGGLATSETNNLSNSIGGKASGGLTGGGAQGSAGQTTGGKVEGNISGAKPDAPATDAKPAAQKNWGACLSAVMAMLQAFMKNQSASDSKKSAKENRKSAQELEAQEASAKGIAVSGSSSPATAGGNTAAATSAATAATSGAGSEVGQQSGASPGYGSGATALTSAAATAQFSNSGIDSTSLTSALTSDAFCASEIASGDAKRQLECAVKFDSTLPRAVNSQGFLSDFQRITGRSFASFLNNRSQSLSSYMETALRPKMNQQQFRKFQILLQDLEKNYQNRTPESAHRPELVNHTQTSLSPLLTAQQIEPTQHLLTSTDLPDQFQLEKIYQDRTPDAVSEDPSLNLFERVSFRYQASYRKMLMRR